MKLLPILLGSLVFLVAPQPPDAAAEPPPAAAASTGSTATNSPATGNNPAPPQKTDPVMGAVAEKLLVILVMSLVFETALTPLFSWSVFLKYLEGKGWKTPITIGLALLVFWGYNLDLVADLLNAMKYPAVRSFWGQLLTALMIAGGSDGVFRLFTKLNIRNPEENRDRAAVLQAQRAVESQGKGELELSGLKTQVAALQGQLAGKQAEIDQLKAKLK